MDIMLYFQLEGFFRRQTWPKVATCDPRLQTSLSEAAGSTCKNASSGFSLSCFHFRDWRAHERVFVPKVPYRYMHVDVYVCICVYMCVYV